MKMRYRLSHIMLLSCVILIGALGGYAQQGFITYASGPAAGNTSTRHIIATVTANPPSSPGSAALLVFQGRGGTPFPSGTTTFIYGSGIPDTQVGFAPDASWLVSFNVNAAALTGLRQNQFGIIVRTPDFPAGEVRGNFHVANGAYNDYDGDGKTDVQVYRSSTNTFYAMRSSDRNIIVQPLGQPGDSVSLTVDFDADGRSDFSTARYTPEVLWRIFHSRTSTLRETRWGSSASGDFFAAADYDGDGASDIAVFRAGVWYIIRSSNGTVIYDFWGASGDAPAANDYDGDGKADLTIARSENSQRVWYTRFSSNGGTRVVQWGLSSDAFFTGRSDFDGDARADLLVIRNVSGQRIFYILRSSDSQLQTFAWGLSSDVVKLGDYDGDGRTDPTVTRAEDGQRVFYILQSASNTPRYETFGLAGDF